MLKKINQADKKKYFFSREPHCGDYLSVCKLCDEKAWLIEDIQHKRDCEVGAVLKELKLAMLKIKGE